ncbi:MAG TPA: hypothetical protein VMF89_18995 [Polyangiales bacterium]|nr:hypothetical protein [Polyangiales bacterium]
MRSMLIERVAGLIVAVHDEQNPSESDWDAYVALVKESLKDGAYFRGVLVTSLGGAPNAGQRKSLQTIADSQVYRTCICTDSVVARGVIIAINWLFSTPMHALPYRDLDRALEILEVPLGERSVAKAAVLRLQSALRDDDLRHNVSA